MSVTDKWKQMQKGLMKYSSSDLFAEKQATGLFAVAHFLYTVGCDSSAGPDGQHAGPGQNKHGHANGHDRHTRNGLHRAAYTTAAFFANGVAEAIDERGVQRLVVNGLLLLAERWRREGFRGGVRGRPCGLRCSARRVDGG